MTTYCLSICIGQGVHKVTSQAMIHSPSSASIQHVSFGPASPPAAASTTLTEQRQRRLDMVSRAHHHTSVSFSRQTTTEEDDEEDPYAWLSRTAPPSPRYCIILIEET